ncbi:MAG: lipoyl(octanoyl) transferase LipB, partial [Bacteroidota bacterium]
MIETFSINKSIAPPIHFTFQDWGLLSYQKAWQAQEQLFKTAIASKMGGGAYDIPQMIIFCEHPHIYTLGKNGSLENLLIDQPTLAHKGIDFVKTDRGGDITYHGYGQLMTYFILDLEQLKIGLRKFIFLIEEAIIHCLDRFGISTTRLENAPGVWTRQSEKICALGIIASRHITMHGLALNINPDLHFFDY